MKRHIVSGASSGVGLALVQALKNDRVVGFGRRMIGERYSSYYPSSPKSYPLGYTYHSLDYTKEYSFDAIHEGLIDSITFCSAQFKMGKLADHSSEEIHNMIATNITAMIEFVKYFQPKMKRDGKIILVSSVSGLRGQKKQTVYSATKHAMQGFADSLRQEIPQRVTTICPGGIDTPLWNESNPYPGDKSLLLKPEQVAKTICDVIRSDDNVVIKNITLHPKNEKH